MHVYLTAHQPGSVQLFPSTFLVLASVWYSSSRVLQEQSVCTEHSPPLTIGRGKGNEYSVFTQFSLTRDISTRQQFFLERVVLSTPPNTLI